MGYPISQSPYAGYSVLMGWGAMLYQLREMQAKVLKPFMAGCGETAELLRDPGMPWAYLPVSSATAAECELLYRLGKDYPKPRFGIESVAIDGDQVNIVEVIVSRRAFCKLVQFRKLREGLPPQPPVLLVASLSGHHATLLREMVIELLAQHDVYITDWADARDVPASDGEFPLKDYVRYVQDFIRDIGAQVHVIAICQPAVPVLAAVSLMASDGDVQPRTMTLIDGPIDCRISPTEVDRLATEMPYGWFEDNLIYPVPPGYPGSGRLVYPGFLQLASFLAMNPGKHLQSHLDFLCNLMKGDTAAAEQHRKFYDEYNAVLDMPAGFYLDTIKSVFQDCSLAKGTWVPNGKLVCPQDIRDVALLTVEGELDDICGVGQTRAAHALCSGIPESRKKHLAVPGAGHYSVFAGHHWRELVCPMIADFIAEHGTEDKIRNRKTMPDSRFDFNKRPAQACATALPVPCALTSHG